MSLFMSICVSGSIISSHRLLKEQKEVILLLLSVHTASLGAVMSVSLHAG